MTASGAGAEQAYQQHLELLRQQAEDVVPTVGARYSALAEDQYSERWSVIQLLADLRHAAAVPVLEDVLRRPIPRSVLRTRRTE